MLAVNALVDVVMERVPTSGEVMAAAERSIS